MLTNVYKMDDGVNSKIKLMNEIELIINAEISPYLQKKKSDIKRQISKS